MSQSGRSAHAARSASMSSEGVKWSALAEDRERRAHVARGVERVAHAAAGPVGGEADHPVERHRAREASGCRGLQRLHAAHAEADHVHAVDTVAIHEEVRSTRQVVELQIVVEVAHHGHAGHRIIGGAHLGCRAAKGSGHATA